MILKSKPRYNIIAILRSAQYCDILYITVFPLFTSKLTSLTREGALSTM